MDQMEAFTEIMLWMFYPAWPGVSPLFLRTVVSHSLGREFFGSCMLMKPCYHSTHLP